MNGELKFDAIIIGAGIIGACTAFEMAKRGWKTLNVDKLPAAGYGSTSFSCAIIRTHYSTLPGTALAYEGSFRWRDWAGYLGIEDERGMARYKQTGCLILKTEGNNHSRSVLGHADELGIEWEDWSADQIKLKFPFMELDCYAPPHNPDHPDFAVPNGAMIEGGIYFPLAGYMNDPQLASHNAQVAAEAHGATFRFKAEVTEIRQSENKVIGITLADGEQIDAPVVINVGGPHSSKINALAGVVDKMTMSTRALRQEVAYIPAMPGFDFENEGPLLSDNDVGIYSRPETGNKMVVGSENPECDTDIWVDPDNNPESLTDQATHQVMRLAQRIPTLGIPGQLNGVVACYDATPDWIPIYDKSDLGGYYMAIGTSGNQFKNAPIAGAMMATLIEACEGGRDHDKDPVSFQLETINRIIDIGFFSRNRAINSDSSFSVLG